MYAVTIRLTISAPDDVLQAVGESYAELGLETELPFVPFPDMRIFLRSLIMEDDPIADRLSELNREVPEVLGVADVRQVCYSAQIDEFTVYCKGHHFPSLDKFHAAIELYRLDHGFTRV